MFLILFLYFGLPLKAENLIADRDRWVTYKTCPDRSDHKQNSQKQTLQVQV